MLTILILLAFSGIVLFLSNKVSSKRNPTKSKAYYSKKLNEDAKKPALNIPGYYEDIVNKDKLKKTYRWELHQSF